MTNHVYVGLKAKAGAKTYLYSSKSEAEGARVRQVLWGDRLQVEAEDPDGWLRIMWSPKKDKQILFIPKIDTQETRPLEIIFVDVGQGDGAVLFTPERNEDERVMVIDAGEGNEMHQFLIDRFKGVESQFRFHAAVLTHPDEDHYKGFEPVFADKRFGFDIVYHSGLVERPEGSKFEKLGGKVTDPQTGIAYVGRLAEANEEMLQLFGDPNALGTGRYPPVIHKAIVNSEVKSFAMLSTAHGTLEGGKSYMPGFAPQDGRSYSIEVLGPVAEADAAGLPRLRVNGSYGETKNGHSVILRLVYGNFSVLFGGDLNAKAERLLLAYYGGQQTLMQSKGGLSKLFDTDSTALIKTAQKRLQSDVMKVCHHGASDVTDEFLAAVHPACFVISSGDDEGHVHPRPDLLGRLGRLGRGGSPVILSTELQRSTRPTEDTKLVEKLKKQIETYRKTGTEAAKAKMNESVDLLARDNVAVYGAIYLKTDGKRLITAFKYERGSDKEKWFYYEYVLKGDGSLELVT